jgi:hypothetical protein
MVEEVDIFNMSKGYEQRKESNKRYLATLDEIRTRIPKGKKNIIIEIAKNSPEKNMNTFVSHAILDKIGVDKWDDVIVLEDLTQ